MVKEYGTTTIEEVNKQKLCGGAKEAGDGKKKKNHRIFKSIRVQDITANDVRGAVTASCATDCFIGARSCLVAYPFPLLFLLCLTLCSVKNESEMDGCSGYVPENAGGLVGRNQAR